MDMGTMNRTALAALTSIDAGVVSRQAANCFAIHPDPSNEIQSLSF